MCFHFSDKLDRVEEGTGIKHQIAGLLHACRFMRGMETMCNAELFRTNVVHSNAPFPTPCTVPLVGINLTIVLIELLLG